MIPFEVPALTGEYAKYPVEKVILKLTGTSGNALSNDVQVEESVTAGENVKHAFKLSAVPSGNYDVDLIYTDSSDNEQFHLYDTLIVWSKFESVLVGSSAYYDDVSYTQGIDDSGSPVAASGTKKGFKITADDIKDYHRTIYYVSGSGGNLPVASGTASGSIFQPFDTIAAAFAEIQAQATLRSEALWQIVVDGNTSAEETSISIDSSVPLSIRRFSAVSGFQISGTQTLTVSGTGSVELKNAVVNANGILNVNAQNLTITNSQLEGLTNIASGSYINVSATDTTSSAAKIKPVDSYNALVLKHIGDTKFTSSFLANYVLEETYSKAGTGAECKRIGPDTATGSATNGDGIIKLYDPNLSIEFDESAYTVVESFTPNPLSQSIAQVTSGTAISLTLTVTQGGSPVASENTSLAVGLYDRAPSQNDSPMTITGEVVNATTNASGIATWSAAFPQYVVQEEGYTGGTYYLKVTYTLNGYNYASIYEVNIVQ